MAWQTPITTWGQSGQTVPSDADFNRIEGNTLELKTALGGHESNSGTHVKPARIVIGTSTAGWTAKDCHYLCDGIDDQVEINSAIQSMVSGGELLILDGIYDISAKISVSAKSGLTIRGSGYATQLRRRWNSTVDEGVITVTTARNVK